MVKDIIKSEEIFKKAENATKEDSDIIANLKETFESNKDKCIGLAANMIGENKAIIIADLGYTKLVLVNPKIVNKSVEYEAEEGCLSLDGLRKVKRYRNIEVEYQTEDFEDKKGRFSGLAAEIIQHEIDHLNGIVI